MTFRPTLMGTHGMVTTEHYLSALIGVQVLKQGGNATDAAVAAIFAEGVLNPHMHTLGGESPMLIYQADTGRVSAINGNTAAAQRATPEWFAEQGLELIPGDGLLAAGVPAAKSLGDGPRALWYHDLGASFHPGHGTRPRWFSHASRPTRPK